MSSILYSSHVELFKLQFRYKITYKSQLVKDGIVITHSFPPYLTKIQCLRKGFMIESKKLFIRLGAQFYFRLSLRSPSDRMYKICHSPKSLSLLWKDKKSLIYILHDILMAISEEKNKFLFRPQHTNQIQ